MPERVVVTYETKRTVYLDGQAAGYTNDTLMVDRGRYVIDLGEPKDYLPENVVVIVKSTTSVGPMTIDAFYRSRGHV